MIAGASTAQTFRYQRLVGVIAAAAFVCVTAGCGGRAGSSTTCDDFAKLDLFARSNKVGDSLRAHQLNELSINLHTQVDKAVDAFCGGPFDPEGNDNARRNGSEPFDKGVRWDDLGL